MASHSLLRDERRQLLNSLFDLEIPNTIKFSPNADQVLYSTNLKWNLHKVKQHSRSTLWLAESGKPNSSRQITSGQFRDHSPRWNPCGDSIAFISDRAAPGEKWAIYGLNVRNGRVEGEVYPITPTENEQQIASFEFSPDGKTIAFISADEKSPSKKAQEETGEDVQVWGQDWPYARLRIVDLDSKNVRRVTEDVDQHIASFSWSADGAQIALVITRTPDIEEPWKTGSQITILTLANQSIMTVLTIPNGTLDMTWAADGKVYFISGMPINKACAGKAVYAVGPDFGSGKNEWEKVSHGVEDDAEALTVVSGKILVQVQHGLEDRVYLCPSQEILYSNSGQTEAIAAACLPGDDAVQLAVVTSSINKPFEVYTINASGSLVQLSSHGAAFQNQHFGTCTILSTPSYDNEMQLDSLFLTPGSEPPDSPMPTVVLIHGGPDARVTDCFDTLYYYLTPYLLRLGYSILSPNYRGSSGKGEAFAAYSLRGCGKWDYEDVVTITNHAIELGYADPKRLVVGGLSQGGFLTYLCSTRNGSRYPWTFSAAIPISGVTDSDAMALTSDLGGTLEPELAAGRAPWNMTRNDTRNRQASALWEVSAAVERSKKTGETVIPPMLILHGEKDERCPITQAWGMKRALEYHGLPFEFVTYPRQPHIFNEKNFCVDLVERFGGWCERYIGPGV